MLTLQEKYEKMIQEKKESIAVKDAEIKELKQRLGTCWYSEVEKHKLDPKAGV